MPCIYGDQPLRIQLTKSGVVHAGSYQDYGGFTRYKYDSIHGIRNGSEYIPKQKRVRIVCRWRGLPKDIERFVVDNKSTITCKNCQKLMGMDETPLAAQRFIVRKKSTAEFFKNTSTRCSPWSDSVTDAFMFKRKHTAQDKCKTGRYEVDGKLYTYSEYHKLPRDRDGHLPKYKYKKILNPDLEVRPVKIIVE